MGILDQIIDSQTQKTLDTFDHILVVAKLLAMLKERERLIIAKRYGLEGHKPSTLKVVGQEHGLTRERVRQIEKDVISILRKNALTNEDFSKARDQIVELITEHGGLMAEHRLLALLDSNTDERKSAIKFLLNLMPELQLLEGHKDIKTAWATPGHNEALISEFVDSAKKILNTAAKPTSLDGFVDLFKKVEIFEKYEQALHDRVIENLLHVLEGVEQNNFGEFGFSNWTEVRPKDVGDKAYLVMKHHNKPEHYAVITEMINKHKLDSRIAYKETVHNKLIKDTRFVLVGRGIYALAEWGYKPGVVADTIKEVLKEAAKPLTRDEIVEAVLKKRMVKRNTILVGLSNKNYFKKAGKNLYALV